MKHIIDNFSTQSANYKKFRPIYPKELYEVILAQVKHRKTCWDCGTGNGQVAQVLAEYFDQVYATDISENQLKNAPQNPKISYQVTRAEATSFESNTFDLVTVAQALHWFDFTAFNQEVKRVCKAGGILCVWGYGLLRIQREVDELVDAFYIDKIGPYWDKERRHIDRQYQDVSFDFPEIEPPTGLKIQTHWNREALLGYMHTWSSVKHYMQQHEGEDPLKEFEEELKSWWKEEESKEVNIPIFLRMGKIEK